MYGECFFLQQIEKLYLLRYCIVEILRESMFLILLYYVSVYLIDEVFNLKGSIYFVLSFCWNGKVDKGKFI